MPEIKRKLSSALCDLHDQCAHISLISQSWWPTPRQVISDSYMTNTWHISILLPRNGHCKFSFPTLNPKGYLHHLQHWRLVLGTRTGTELHLGGFLSFPPFYTNPTQGESQSSGNQEGFPGHIAAGRHSCIHLSSSWLHLGSRDLSHGTGGFPCPPSQSRLCQGPLSHTGISRL